MGVLVIANPQYKVENTREKLNSRCPNKRFLSYFELFHKNLFCRLEIFSVINRIKDYGDDLDKSAAAEIHTTHI